MQEYEMVCFSEILIFFLTLMKYFNYIFIEHNSVIVRQENIGISQKQNLAAVFK